MDAHRDVVIVGGGVAGLSAAVFTARQGLNTLIIDSERRTPSDSRTQSDNAGGSLLRRNAHLENFPGFPLGVNARQLLDLLSEQAMNAGADSVDARVTRVVAAEEFGSDELGSDDVDRFRIETNGDRKIGSQYVIAATKNEVGYLTDIDGIGIIDRGKAYVDVDERGRTGVDGLYAAGRLAEKPHQAVVCAGHGAEVAITLLEEDETPFYHDWVAPEGYFSDRGREVPPGCEEIDEPERRAREAASLDAMRERFAEPHPDPQETHPSLEE